MVKRATIELGGGGMMKHRFLKWAVGPGRTVGLVLIVAGFISLSLMIFGMLAWHEVHYVSSMLLLGSGLYGCRRYYGVQIAEPTTAAATASPTTDLADESVTTNGDGDDLVAMMAAKVLTDEHADTDDYMLASLALHPADGPSDNLDPYVAAALFDEPDNDFNDGYDD